MRLTFRTFFLWTWKVRIFLQSHDIWGKILRGIQIYHRFSCSFNRKHVVHTFVTRNMIFYVQFAHRFAEIRYLLIFIVGWCEWNFVDFTRTIFYIKCQNYSQLASCISKLCSINYTCVRNQFHLTMCRLKRYRALNV